MNREKNVFCSFSWLFCRKLFTALIWKFFYLNLKQFLKKCFFYHNCNSFCRFSNHYSFHSRFVKTDEWYYCDDFRYWIDFVVLCVFSHFQRDCRVFCANWNRFHLKNFDCYEFYFFNRFWRIANFLCAASTSWMHRVSLTCLS